VAVDVVGGVHGIGPFFVGQGMDPPPVKVQYIAELISIPLRYAP
jgi:hypothetical protein